MALSGAIRDIVLSPPLLILDKIQGAVAAYSFKRLSSKHRAACIQVRRSSDDALAEIGFVNNYLDTASLLSFCGASSGFVRTWYDQSRANKNSIQFTNLRQPQIVNSGVLNTIDGKPIVKFDGVNDELLSLVGLHPIYTLFATVRYDSTGSVVLSSYNGLTEDIRASTYLLPVGSVGSYSLTTQKQLTILRQSGNSKAFVNQVQSGTTNVNTFAAPTSLELYLGDRGGDTPTGCSWSEFIMFPFDASAADIQSQLNFYA